MVNDKLRPDIAVCALILSAGYSSRMGDFKPLLKVGDVPAIGRIADAFREAGVNQIIAVTGYKRELLKPILKEKGIEEGYNKDFYEGMYESVKTGIRAAMAKPSVPLSAYLLLPVDCPLVPAKIINRIVQEHKKHPESFIVPCYHGKKGHPLLIPSIYEGEILAYNGERGLKAVTTRHEDKMLRIETDCEAVVLDMDTPEGYQEILCYYEKQKNILSGKESPHDYRDDLRGRRLFLVRHGETRQHAEKIFMGQFDVPLSEKGRKQAATAGAELTGYRICTDRIYASDLIRTTETAALIAESLHCPEIIKEPGLREMSLGEWDGVPIREIKDQYPELYRKRGENLLSFKLDNDSENFYDLQYRVVKTVKKILTEDENADIIIVAHSGVIKVLQSDIYSTPLLHEVKKPISHGQVTVLTFPKNSVLYALNAK